MFLNKYKYLILVFCLAFALRMLNLSSIPNGITHDELDYVLNAKSIWLTGKDLSGSWSPLTLAPLKSRMFLAELTSLIVSPFIGPFNLSLINARIPYIFFSSLSVVILYLIVKKTINEKVALIAGLLLAINPWSFYFGRTAFESPVSLFFFLSGFYLLLITKAWNILFAFPFFFLAFFTYHGSKFLFLPFVLVSLLINYFLINKKKGKSRFWPYLIFFFFSLLLIFYFALSFNFQPADSRSGEILFMNNLDKVESLVNSERAQAIPNKFINIFSNKPLYVFKEIVKKYFGAFSTNYLFLTGDTLGVEAFSFWFHGLFYYIDFFFILIGFCSLLRKNKKAWLIFTSLVVISPITSSLSVSGNSYVLRASLLFPSLIVFAAYGIYYSIIILKSKFKIDKTISSAVIAFIYFIFLTNFLYLYFYRFPVYKAEAFFFSERILSEYIRRVKIENPEVNVYANTREPIATFEQYIFYSNLYNKENIKEITKIFKEENYSNFQNVNFVSKCLDKNILSDKNIVVIQETLINCKDDENTSYISNDNALKVNKSTISAHNISNLKDAGQIFKIYNDILCNKFQLASYPRATDLKDFKLNQDNENFCRKWISN